MASETIKALLMITLFCGLQSALYLPQLINSPTVRRWRRAMSLRRPRSLAHAPVSYALIPARASRRRPQNTVLSAS